MSNFDKHVLAFFPTHIRFGPIQRLQSIRKIINFWYTFGWKWWVISFCDYLGLLDACSYDVDDVTGRVDRFGFQNFCSPGLEYTGGWRVVGEGQGGGGWQCPVSISKWTLKRSWYKGLQYTGGWRVVGEGQGGVGGNVQWTFHNGL